MRPLNKKRQVCPNLLFLESFESKNISGQVDFFFHFFTRQIPSWLATAYGSLEVMVGAEKAVVSKVSEPLGHMGGEGGLPYLATVAEGVLAVTGRQEPCGRPSGRLLHLMTSGPYTPTVLPSVSPFS